MTLIAIDSLCLAALSKNDLSTVFSDLSTVFSDLSTVFSDLSTVFSDSKVRDLTLYLAQAVRTLIFSHTRCPRKKHMELFGSTPMRI